MSNASQCNANTLARLFHVSERRIQQLATQKVIPKAGHGQYDLIGAVQGYVRYLQQQMPEEQGKGPTIAQSKAKLLALQAQAKELEVAQLQGQLVDVEEVHQVWNHHILTARAKLLALPRKAAAQVKDMSDYGQIERFLTDLVDEALDELAADEKSIETTTGELAIANSVESE